MVQTGTHADAVTLSQDLLAATKRGEPTGDLRERLASLDPGTLERDLSDDDRRVAFWVNVYNAAVQFLLADDPSLYDSRWRFFRKPRVRVAGEHLSLNDIEHGILRRSTFWWSLGYLRNPVPGGFERTHRVDELDPRIHFALNCGAASCPPILNYSASDIDAELGLATESYLDSAVDYDPEADAVSVSRLFLWYRGDFGGRSGIREFLRRHGAIPADASPSLSYNDYDWQLDLDNYLDAEPTAED